MEPVVTLFSDDLVAKKSRPTVLAVVERTHTDVDTHIPISTRLDNIVRHKEISTAAFKQFKTDGIPPIGTVLIRLRMMQNVELIPESRLILIDRSLLMGDVVKRNEEDPMTGVVINQFTSCVLQPMCNLELRTNGDHTYRLHGLLPPQVNQVKIAEADSGKPPELLDVPLDELEVAFAPAEEDFVIYKEWIGRVQGFYGYVVLKLADNCVVEISDEFARHVDNASEYFQIGDVAASKKGHLRTGNWIFGQYNPNTPPVGTVVNFRLTSLTVDWLHAKPSHINTDPPHSVLERDEIESSDFHVYDRSRRPINGASESSPTTSMSEVELRVRNMRMRFRDLSSACAKYNGAEPHGKLTRIDRRDTLGYDLNLFDIISTKTDVVVQWQDQSLTREKAVNLLPDSALDDDHAVWPGEIAHTLDLRPMGGASDVYGPSKVGVVQTVNAQERTAKMKWCSGAHVAYSLPPTGVEGSRMYVLGRVGVADGEVEEVSLYDIEAPLDMNVRRGDAVVFVKPEAAIQDFAQYPRGVNWAGEIVDTLPDGTMTVRLGAAETVRDVNVKRDDVMIAIRSDGTNSYEDDEVSAMDSEMLEDLVYQGPNSREFDHDSEYYSDRTEDEDERHSNEANARYEDENGDPMDIDEVEDEDWESDESDVEQGTHAPAPQSPPLPNTTDNDNSSTSTPPNSSRRTNDNPATLPSSGPDPYLILDTPIPSTHYYRSTNPTNDAAHLKRVAKEHKILRSPSSLPSGVYVRTWESRLDLLRVLLVGPAETPYAHCPFVIDIHLPATFPSEPPKAFFHSWTSRDPALRGGVGRVNPNLYEEGKICLSLLGTWEGDKGEGWNAVRSTLLQVLVSLLGLVLVKEPYFNEAGYEPLAGLESSRRPSALYSEKAFVRARGFMIEALERLGVGGKEQQQQQQQSGIEGLEDVITWLYRDADGPGLLETTVRDVDEVLRRSEEGGEPDGLTLLSKGACIPLRRIGGKLRSLQ